MIRAIMTDIEGTTTDIRFVHQVLFPYARARLADFITRHGQDLEVLQVLDALREEINQPQAEIVDLVDQLYVYMDKDEKSPALKTLQGIIWRTGYTEGDFRGHVYPDVVPQLTQWQQQGIKLYVYSSGSVDAQRLLFGYSEEGDLLPLFTDYFDTRVGAKREVASYQAIAEQLLLPAQDLLFLSDIRQELDAAREAGWQTVQLIRDEPDELSDHRQVNRFDQIELN
jgi:enolase-phosphatase E1